MAKKRGKEISTKSSKAGRYAAQEAHKSPPAKDRTEHTIAALPPAYLGKCNPVSAQERFSKRFQGLGI